MILVRAGGGDHGKLCTSGRTLLGRCQKRVDTKLGNGIQGDGNAGPGALRLIHDVGRVHTVVGEVAIVQAPPGESDRPLVAATGIDRTRDICGQRSPVASVERQLVRLLLFDQAGNRGAAPVQQR